LPISLARRAVEEPSAPQPITPAIVASPVKRLSLRRWRRGQLIVVSGPDCVAVIRAKGPRPSPSCITSASIAASRVIALTVRASSLVGETASIFVRKAIFYSGISASDDNSTAAVPLTQGCNAVPNRENELGWRLSSPSPRRSTAYISCRSRRDTDWERGCIAENHFAQARPSAPRPASISFTLQSLIWIAAIWWLAEQET
jgi:hypothetical protein